MKMNQEIKDEWIKDLLSGEFHQGNGRLHTVFDDGSEEFCCLGLLCRIAVKHKVIPDPVEPTSVNLRTDSFGYYRYGAENAKFYLPEEVAKWAGIDHNGKYFKNQKESTLARDNDEGKSFEEIAQTIREKF